MAIVWWDLDGVHSLWDDGVDEIAREMGADLRGFPLKHERTSFEFYKEKTEAEQKMILEIMGHPDLYKRLKADPRVTEAFVKVREAGHINRFASTPWTGNLTCMQDKEDFVANVYGEEARKHLVLLHDKTVLRGDLLIDDKPVLHGLMEDDLDPIHVIPSQPYNLDVDTPYRIKDWEKDLPMLLEWLDDIHIHKTIQKITRANGPVYIP